MATTTVTEVRMIKVEAYMEEDGLVPCLEEDLLQNPLIKDSFIGVPEPVLKWPLDVEFVETDGNPSSEFIDYSANTTTTAAYSFYRHHAQQQQFLNYQQQEHVSSSSRQRHESFNFGQLFASNPDSISHQTPQGFVSTAVGQNAVTGVGQYKQPVQGNNGNTFEGWLEDKADLAALGGWPMTESPVVPPSLNFVSDIPAISNEDDVMVLEQAVDDVDGQLSEKEQILQEIVRECEEIERRSNASRSQPHSPYSSTSASSSPLDRSRSSTASPIESNSHNVSLATSKKIAYVLKIGANQSTKTRSPPSKEKNSLNLKMRLPKQLQKERKRAQNREAASRYRERKRREKDQQVGELMQLEGRNAELKTRADDLEYEIRYLKKLMREIGLSNP